MVAKLEEDEDDAEDPGLDADMVPVCALCTVPERFIDNELDSPPMNTAVLSSSSSISVGKTCAVNIPFSSIDCPTAIPVMVVIARTIANVKDSGNADGREVFLGIGVFGMCPPYYTSKPPLLSAPPHSRKNLKYGTIMGK